ncbi:MAG: DUF4126 domain-containing protein [Synechococcales cyanobacterium RM1_1_8]|nr:DUF4126 domain-containing protein [Synechococcales cyanobacterium RM1_1_8]
MIAILASISAAAAGGLRIALPLLVIGFARNMYFWEQVPLLSRINPQVLLGILVSWTLCELFLAKNLLGQRIQQTIQIGFSPLAGGILGSAVALNFGLERFTVVILGLLGAAIALVLQLVQSGWFFRLRGLPLWFNLAEDILCISLVLLAFDAPTQGGIIALLLLWLALRSSAAWRYWYVQQAAGPGDDPRAGKSAPD